MSDRKQFSDAEVDAYYRAKPLSRRLELFYGWLERKDITPYDQIREEMAKDEARASLRIDPVPD